MKRNSLKSNRIVVKNKFSERCYTMLKKVPAGSVTTYGELAKALGTKAYRAVGQAMNRNPNAPQVPCHRVVCSDGSIGGYAFGVEKKKKILKKEGIEVRAGKIVDFSERLHRF